MGERTVHELVAETRDHLAVGDINAALDSLSEAVQRTFEVAQTAAVRAGVPQEPQEPQIP